MRRARLRRRKERNEAVVDRPAAWTPSSYVACRAVSREATVMVSPHSPAGAGPRLRRHRPPSHRACSWTAAPSGCASTLPFPTVRGSGWLPSEQPAWSDGSHPAGCRQRGCPDAAGPDPSLARYCSWGEGASELETLARRIQAQHHAMHKPHLSPRSSAARH